MSVIRSQCLNEEEYLETLRNDFAAAAMQGWQKYPEIHQDKIAQMSYVLADAMLKAREQ